MTEPSTSPVHVFALRRRLPRTGLRPLVPGLAAVAALEAYGRWSPNDRWDILGVVALLVVLLVTAERLSRRSLARLRLARRRLHAYLAPLRIEFGVDLRGEPPLQRKAPPAYIALIAAVFAFAAVAALTHAGWPTTARETLGAVSGLLLLVATAAGWTLLLVVIGLGFSLPAMIVRAHQLDDPSPSRRRAIHNVVAIVFALAGATLGWLLVDWRTALIGVLVAGLVTRITRRFRTFALTLLAVILAWVLLDVRVGLAALVLSGVLVSGVVLLPMRRPLLLAWRPGPSAAPRCLSGGGATATITLATVAALLTLFLLASGDRLLGVDAGAGAGIGVDDLERLDPTLITAWLGFAALWTTAVCALCLVATQLQTSLMARLHSPDRPVPTRVRIEAERGPSSSERRAITQALRALGLRAVFGDRRVQPHEVAIRLVDGSVERDPFEEPSWPLVVSPSELLESDSDALVPRLVARRDETQRRAVVLTGIRRLLAHAESRAFERGTGFWLAPHLWFIERMSRDTDEEDSWFVGPPYYQVFHRAARAHLAAALDAVAVDLLFVEDGVGADRTLRVLELVFEHVDLFGDTRPADERHFTGVPGVRVLIHACEFAEPAVEKAYAETDYDELARARILHVFLDRGEDEADVSVPDFGSRVPSGMPGLLPV